jgi:pantoate--beta-alanine ligase
MKPRVIRKIPALRTVLAAWRGKRRRIALVPTMGALHEGHLSLVRLARRRADRVVVSIFVNPAQFAPNEDFARYPRTWDTDIGKLAAEGVDLVFAPAADEVYPAGFATSVELRGPATVGLEDRFRPHFFGGVATVVAKLLIEVMPDEAFFGEKDYQQLQVVRRMTRDLDLPVRIIAAPTVREPDGLALSSRNVYLSAEDRQRAPLLQRVLLESAEEIARGEPIESVLALGRTMLAQGGFAVDYLEARHAETLAPVSSAGEGPLRLLAAARLGSTRLIDNVAVAAARRRTAGNRRSPARGRRVRSRS